MINLKLSFYCIPSNELSLFFELSTSFLLSSKVLNNDSDDIMSENKSSESDSSTPTLDPYYIEISSDLFESSHQFVFRNTKKKGQRACPNFALLLHYMNFLHIARNSSRFSETHHICHFYQTIARNFITKEPR